MAETAGHDPNFTTSLQGVSPLDNSSPVNLWVNPDTHRLYMDTPGAQTSGGWIPYKLVSAATTNATTVKPGAGQIGGWALYNLNASPRYVKFYHKLTPPTVGTDPVAMTILVPGNANGSGSNIGVNFGISFPLGISFATTTGMPDSDTGAVAANEIIVNLFWI